MRRVIGRHWWVGLVLVSILIGVAAPAVSAELDASAAERDAIAALGLADGECVAEGYVFRPKIDPAAVDKTASSTGWASGIYIGTVDELAADRKGTVVSQSASAAWVASQADAKPLVNEFRPIALPSGRTAWALETSLQAAPCE
jgi:Tfp pilus assembly protein FimT